MMDQIDDDVSMTSSEDEDDLSKISHYRQQIAVNPEDYESHFSLIECLHNSEDFIGARAAREDMNIHYPLSPSMWLEWVKDEEKFSSDKEFTYKLLRRATEDYRSVDIWLELCQFSLGYFSDKNEIRQIFEEAISQVGTQYDGGFLIWTSWMIYEKDVLKEADKVLKLYQRQLSLPLDKNAALFDEFLDWNKEHRYPEEEEIRAKFVESSKKAELLVPFEKSLNDAAVDYAAKKTTNTTGMSREECWLTYLTFAEDKLGKLETVNLYERAITDICLSQPLWSHYLRYLSTHFETDADRVLTACKRAVRNNKSSLELRLGLIRHQERFLCPAEDIRASINAAFRAQLSDASPFLALWLAYLDFERRQVSIASTRDLTIIRGLSDRLLALENYLDYDSGCVLVKYLATIEAQYGEMAKAHGLWTVVRRSLGTGSAAVWLENLEFEKRFGNVDSCRRLMSNAVNCVTDYPEYLFEKVLRWAAEEADIETYWLFMKRTETQQAKVNERRAKEAAVKTTPEPVDRKLKRKNEEREGDTPRAKKVKVVERMNKASPSKPPPIVEKREFVEHVEERSVFVSNLCFKVTEAELRTVFGRCGDVEDVRIARKVGGESRGFAYIQYRDEVDIEAALKLEHTMLMERPMYVSRADPAKRHTFNYAVGETEKNKLFVRNLPRTITEEAMKEIFGKVGSLRGVRLVRWPNGGMKGIAYVEYGDENTASRAIVATNGLVVGDNTIEVMLSNTPAKRVGLGGTGDGGDVEGEVVGAGGKNFMVPRAVKRAPTTQKKLIHQTPLGHSVTVAGGDKIGNVAKTNEDFRKLLG